MTRRSYTSCQPLHRKLFSSTHFNLLPGTLGFVFVTCDRKRTNIKQKPKVHKDRVFFVVCWEYMKRILIWLHLCSGPPVRWYIKRNSVLTTPKHPFLLGVKKLEDFSSTFRVDFLRWVRWPLQLRKNHKLVPQKCKVLYTRLDFW